MADDKGDGPSSESLDESSKHVEPSFEMDYVAAGLVVYSAEAALPEAVNLDDIKAHLTAEAEDAPPKVVGLDVQAVVDAQPKEEDELGTGYTDATAARDAATTAREEAAAALTAAQEARDAAAATLAEKEEAYAAAAEEATAATEAAGEEVPIPEETVLARDEAAAADAEAAAALEAATTADADADASLVASREAVYAAIGRILVARVQADRDATYEREKTSRMSSLEAAQAAVAEAQQTL